MNGEEGAFRGAVPFASTLERAQQGDERALEDLWRWLRPAVLRYLTVAARDAAEDLDAETWLAVARGLGRFSGDEAGFRAWVFTIARRRVLDHHRRVARAPRLASGGTVPELPDGTDPASLVVRDAGTRQALALLATLPADQAEILALRVIADLDVAEVAAIVGKSPGAVRVAAHRGLRRLARELAPDGAPVPALQVVTA